MRFALVIADEFDVGCVYGLDTKSLIVNQCNALWPQQ